MSARVFNGIGQVEGLQVGKGGLPPLKIHISSTLKVMDLERGQATLPNLQII
jgi:hypothetical protein